MFARKAHPQLLARAPSALSASPRISRVAASVTSANHQGVRSPSFPVPGLLARRRPSRRATGPSALERAPRSVSAPKELPLASQQRRHQKNPKPSPNRNRITIEKSYLWFGSGSHCMGCTAVGIAAFAFRAPIILAAVTRARYSLAGEQQTVCQSTRPVCCDVLGLRKQ